MSVAPPLTVVDLARESASLAPGLPSRLLARFNESGARLSVFQGDAHGHEHAGTDEVFVVLTGELLLDAFQGPTITVGPGQLVMIPGAMVHRPRATVPSVLLCFKRLGGHTAYYEEIPADDPGQS